MPRADFITGLFFLCLGGFMVAEGVRLPGAGGFIEEGGEPGRVPIVLGLIISALAVVLVVRSVARRGHWLSTGEVADAETKSALRRAAITAVGCTFYALGLVGQTWFGIDLPYTVVTFLFVFAFIAAAEWDLACGIAARRWHYLKTRHQGLARSLAPVSAVLPPRYAPYAWLLLTAALQGAAVAWAVAYLFEEQFLVTLP